MPKLRREGALLFCWPARQRRCWRNYTAMGWCTIWLLSGAALAVVGWALAFAYRRRAVRYRAAFDRAFAIAQRVYHFSDDETDELTRLIGDPLEQRRGEANR